VRATGAVALLLLAGVLVSTLPSGILGPEEDLVRGEGERGVVAPPEGQLPSGTGVDREPFEVTLLAGEHGAVQARLLGEEEVVLRLLFPESAPPSSHVFLRIVERDGFRSIEGTFPVPSGGAPHVALDLEPGWLSQGTYDIEVYEFEGAPGPVLEYALGVE
jgi:hypothetical protein